MNIAEKAGGSSRNGQENGDASNDCERPLKKARFAWQVKGKYHLKNDANVNETSKTSIETSSAPDVIESSGSGSSSNNRDAEQNLEILGDYLMKQDFNNLDSVLTVPDQSLITPSTSISKEKLTYPRYVSTYEQNIPNNVSKGESSCNNMPTFSLSMVESENISEDQCIARWQTQQMLKGFVDNTINRVLDNWIHTPTIPEDERSLVSSRSVVLDVADFINNLPGDNSVENEGILMAISAHGLQHPSSSNNSYDNDDSYMNTAREETEQFNPLTPLPSDDETHEPVNNNNHCDTDTSSSSDLDMTWSYCNEPKNESNDTNQFRITDTSGLSYQVENDSPQNSSVESVSTDNPGADCDFLDAAILFAIQSKGLTTFGLDYG